MPTYQYRCTECGEDLEVVQKFSDEPLTVCPACQGALRKVFSPVGIVFKGSGFYRTDSRKGSLGSGRRWGEEGQGARRREVRRFVVRRLGQVVRERVIFRVGLLVVFVGLVFVGFGLGLVGTGLSGSGRVRFVLVR